MNMIMITKITIPAHNYNYNSFAMDGRWDHDHVLASFSFDTILYETYGYVPYYDFQDNVLLNLVQSAGLLKLWYVYMFN